MSRFAHASCGYSPFAPGCADELCLLHRIDVGLQRGWDVAALQERLDAVVADAVTMLLVGTAISEREREA